MEQKTVSASRGGDGSFNVLQVHKLSRGSLSCPPSAAPCSPSGPSRDRSSSETPTGEDSAVRGHLSRAGSSPREEGEESEDSSTSVFCDGPAANLLQVDEVYLTGWVFSLQDRRPDRGQRFGKSDHVLRVTIHAMKYVPQTIFHNFYRLNTKTPSHRENTFYLLITA